MGINGAVQLFASNRPSVPTKECNGAGKPSWSQ